MPIDAAPLGAKSRRTPAWCWILVGLLAALLAAFILAAAAGWHALFVPYPNSAWLPACGNSGYATGAPSSPRTAPPLYLYTLACFLTSDTPDQVDTWYRQQGWGYSPMSGTARLANLQLGVVAIHFQQTAVTRVKGNTTTIYIGYVVDIRPIWP